MARTENHSRRGQSHTRSSKLSVETEPTSSGSNNSSLEVHYRPSRRASETRIRIHRSSGGGVGTETTTPHTTLPKIRFGPAQAHDRLDSLRDIRDSGSNDRREGAFTVSGTDLSAYMTRGPHGSDHTMRIMHLTDPKSADNGNSKNSKNSNRSNRSNERSFGGDEDEASLHAFFDSFHSCSAHLRDSRGHHILSQCECLARGWMVGAEDRPDGPAGSGRHRPDRP